MLSPRCSAPVVHACGRLWCVHAPVPLWDRRARVQAGGRACRRPYRCVCGRMCMRACQWMGGQECRRVSMHGCMSVCVPKTCTFVVTEQSGQPARMHASTNVYTQARTCAHSYECAHARIHACARAYVRTCTCTRAHPYTCKRVHAHAHTHMLTCMRVFATSPM